ncbi:hypothetical protein [Novosphingobium sp. Gsoil 351]|uniref:hypothetical protein n=1 Tax=Novosphingobium sp. Gsoil 351 TaxID=2675225 RepID=UPI0012B4CAB4|nr:hypothetical protein [Novosphingobium sp. Gsoil 351]QGN54175.1 hypothetical protein GKE62_06070 [Novosphingobium sp. Gsoil 351]
MEKLDLAASKHNEAWLQALAHDYPEILPIADIEPRFGELFAVAREVPCAHGYIDNLYVTPGGDLVLVEAKLWKNPQARREVVAQALDYVAALTGMPYEVFEAACCKGQGMTVSSLHALVAEKPDALPEEDFIDAVTRNLRSGRMLVMALGDGIRTETEALADLLQSHAGSHFTFALVELSLWRNPLTGELVALPSTLVRTAMITRGVVTIESGVAVVKAAGSAKVATKATTISEELYYEALAKKDPGLPAQIRAFVTLLEPLGVYPELKAALNLKADFPEAAGTINFGYINKNGKVWTDPFAAAAPAQLANAYNQRLADLIGGVVAFDYKGRSFVSTNGAGAPTVDQLLPVHAEAWAEAIAKAIDAIREIEKAGPGTPAEQT